MPGVDENSVSAVGPILTALRSFTNDTGCSIFILHHYNKGAGYSPHASQGLRVRGSTDILAAMDAVVAVTVSAALAYSKGYGPRTAPRRIHRPHPSRSGGPSPGPGPILHAPSG
jgi:hypothetical protein